LPVREDGVDRLGVGHDVGEGRVLDRRAGRERRVEAAGEEIVLRQHLVVKNAKATTDRRFAVAERVPRDPEPWRDISQGGIAVPAAAHGERGVGYVAKIRNLTVRFGWHRHELVANANSGVKPPRTVNTILR